MAYAIVAFVLWVVVPTCGLLWLRQRIGPDPGLLYLTVLLVGLPALCWFFIYIYPTAIYPRVRRRNPTRNCERSNVEGAMRIAEPPTGRS